MKKVFIVLSLMISSLFAVSGEEIFQKKCASCHTKAMENIHYSNMKAPPMSMISMRIKNSTKNKYEFIAFVKDYIQFPSEDKGVCMPMAYQRFGTMPAIGKKMTKNERETVAAWLYDTFENTWKDSTQRDMRCGAGKCGGSQKPPMRCGAGKCGGSQKSPMRCGAGM